MKLINLFSNLFKNKSQKKSGFSVKIDPEYEKASQLIKQATQKKGNLPEAISLIEKALSIYDNPEWYHKLANYQFKSGNRNAAIITAHRMSELERLERFRIWEKDKNKKAKYEAIIHIKKLIDFCTNEGFKIPEIFQQDFNNEEVNLAYEKYLKEAEPLLTKLHEISIYKVKFRKENRYELLEKTRNMTCWEIHQSLLKEDENFLNIITKINAIPIPIELPSEESLLRL